MIQSASPFGPATYPSRLIATEYTTLRIPLLRLLPAEIRAVGREDAWPSAHHTRLFLVLFAAFCVSLCFTIRSIRSYGIGRTSKNLRLPFSPA